MDSKRSKDYKYSAVYGDEPGDVQIETLGDFAANKRPKKTLLKIAMGSILVTAALFLAVGYVLALSHAFEFTIPNVICPT